MRLNVVLRYVGIILLVIALFMLLAAGVSYANNIDSGFYPLLLSSLLTALLGAFPLIFVDRVEQLSSKEGYCIVVSSWILACFVGMFPYLIWGGEFTPINAWFESVSGYTTTGASILVDIEALPRGILFWRACSTWLGGVGVVMFALLILPSLGTNKAMLTNVELSPMAKHNYHYKATMIAQILLLIYVGLTLCSTLGLKLAGMNWFDALTHAMSTVATSKSPLRRDLCNHHRTTQQYLPFGGHALLFRNRRNRHRLRNAEPLFRRDIQDPSGSIPACQFSGRIADLDNRIRNGRYQFVDAGRHCTPACRLDHLRMCRIDKRRYKSGSVPVGNKNVAFAFFLTAASQCRHACAY